MEDKIQYIYIQFLTLKLYSCKKNKGPIIKSSKKTNHQISVRKKSWKPYITLLQEPILYQILKKVFYLMYQSIKQIKIASFYWNIGLEDYYYQGIVNGLLYSIPKTKQFCLDGNFLNTHELDIRVYTYPIHMLYLGIKFILCFPWWSVYKLYKKYINKTSSKNV